MLINTKIGFEIISSRRNESWNHKMIQLQIYPGSLTSVLVKDAVAVKLHHDHGNWYKGKHLIWWLTISEI